MRASPDSTDGDFRFDVAVNDVLRTIDLLSFTREDWIAAAQAAGCDGVTFFERLGQMDHAVVASLIWRVLCRDDDSITFTDVCASLAPLSEDGPS